MKYEHKGLSHLFSSDSFIRSEKSGCLTPEQLAVIVERRLFKLFMPSSYGGLDLTLPEALHIQEELASIDGSLGWTVTLCAGAGLFSGYIIDEVNELFATDSAACWGGSGAVSGTAMVSGEGYVVNGLWHYATGAPHCNGFTANCAIIDRAGNAVINADGSAKVLSFIFKPDEVHIIHSWKTSGMVATASHSFEVKNRFVAANRTYIIDPRHATRAGAVYRFPFLQFAESTFAANFLGMGTHFLTEAASIINRQRNTDMLMHARRDTLLGDINVQLTRMSLLRDALLASVSQTWTCIANNQTPEESYLSEISRLSKEIRKNILSAVHDIYPYCGIEASIAQTTINRVWRDLHTASQHRLMLY